MRVITSRLFVDADPVQVDIPTNKERHIIILSTLKQLAVDCEEID